MAASAVGKTINTKYSRAETKLVRRNEIRKLLLIFASTNILINIENLNNGQRDKRVYF